MKAIAAPYSKDISCKTITLLKSAISAHDRILGNILLNSTISRLTVFLLNVK